MALSFPSFIKSSLLCLTLLSSLSFFFFLQAPRKPPLIPKRSLLSTSSCYTLHSSDSDSALIDYLYLHYCLFNGNSFLSIPFLSLLLLLDFYILIKTAQSHFSVVTTKLSSLLNLSPSMAAVTLLALGNGAPDVFASLHAVRTGHYRTGFGAILSAGTFVSAFVVGFVAIYAAPFGVKPAPFIRDVLFYLTGALFLFYVYLSGEIFVWQAAGFVAFYVFFVGFVFWMDFGTEREEEKPILEKEMVTEDHHLLDKIFDVERGLKAERKASEIAGVYEMISKAWEVPISLLLKLTIPQSSPSEWNRFYQSANIALCPLALLYVCNSYMPFDHPIMFLLANTPFPLWFVVLFSSFSLAVLHFILEKEPPKNEQIPVVIIAFVMSVFWISTVAGELLNCLAALGLLLELPPALLGLTVLAWGNSVGDLVADVAVAKAGHPAMAMAGCFAGPMFNMLVGLGSALVMQTANVYPEAYKLNFHVGIIIAFVFLLLSLMGSLLVITWSRFRVPRFWGFCLVGLYIVFTLVSLIIAKFSG
ncbi:Cation/calcium exchanger 5 [Hibiscus syriacus]|uniref:Cation/calcium exchanger 5 n=1 Tax=Hibiscus syriacus TaxID=106335 RepID=A0A6A2XIM5_HIBSY|nr:cation/calcium exchanger 5-like [Hibiscus syriacus]KAE8675372.1 Cation/calcium exchanger 5 [Hibiscus syriacus]